MPSLIERLKSLGRTAATGPRSKPSPTRRGTPSMGRRPTITDPYSEWTYPPQPVRSSNLASVAYSEPRQLMRVEFVNGTTYDYEGVSLGYYRALMVAASKGSFHYHAIRTDFPYHRIS